VRYVMVTDGLQARRARWGGVAAADAVIAVSHGRHDACSLMFTLRATAPVDGSHA